MKFISHNVEETENFAFKLASYVKEPAIVCLLGNLGAGKTAFTRGFARYFGIEKGLYSLIVVVLNSFLINKILSKK